MRKKRLLKFGVAIAILGAIAVAFKDDRQPLPEQERVMISSQIQESIDSLRVGKVNIAKLRELASRIDSLEHHYKVKGVHGEEHIVADLTGALELFYLNAETMERKSGDDYGDRNVFEGLDNAIALYRFAIASLRDAEQLAGNQLEDERKFLGEVMDKVLKAFSVNINRNKDNAEIRYYEEAKKDFNSLIDFLKNTGIKVSVSKLK